MRSKALDSDEARRLNSKAEQAVIALRALLQELSPAPSWRAELADMTAAALEEAKAALTPEQWRVGWDIVAVARRKPTGKAPDESTARVCMALRR